MKNKNPRVGIGLPVYNGEKYLVQAIESILAQTYTDFELIISDNASSDRTKEICQAYAADDQRIRYYRNERNLGAAPNFNRVFELSSSEYFKWAAYDDIIAPEFLSRCVEALDENPIVVLCVPRSTIIDENGEVLGDYNYTGDASSQKVRVRFWNQVLNLGAGFEVFGLMRVSAVRKTALHGNYPASDLVLLAELTLYGEFCVVPERLLFPRYHPDQSVLTIPVERDRTLFYDTSLEGKIVLPKWQYLNGYLKAIRNAPLSWHERVGCYATMIGWILKPDHFRALGKDVLLAANKLRTRDFTQPEASSQHTE